MWNLHLTFVLCSASQKEGGDFAKFCGLLRIYELYMKKGKNNNPTTKNENVKWKGNGYSFISKKQLVGLSSQQSKGVKSSTFFGQRAGADNWQ